MCHAHTGTKSKVPISMIFPFGVEFHADQRLFVWRPRGLLNEDTVTDVVAALGQLEAELREPFNRFSDSAGVDQIAVNYDYVISVSLYRRSAYALLPPIKSAILATDPTLVHIGQVHRLITQDAPIEVRVFPDDRPAIAQWLGVPLDLLAAAPSSGDMADGTPNASSRAIRKNR
jgi:hypothetical protein